jgi:hypothetical protein
MPMCDSSAACPRSCGQSLHRGPAVHSALYGGAPGAFPRGTLRSAAPTGASEVSRFSCRKFLGVHWGLRLRRTAPELALSFRRMLPSAQVQKRRRPDWGFSEINYPAHLSPVYASCRLSRGATQNSGPSGSLFLTRKASSSSASYRFIPAHGLQPSRTTRCSAHTTPAADFRCSLQSESLHPQSCLHDLQRISRSKINRLPRATAGFTTSALDGYGLRYQLLARPPP